MINLNDTIWKITSYGFNKNFYYITVSDEVNVIDYVIDVSVIDKTNPVLPQIYNYILTQPEFAGGVIVE
jgi:hypothetical protein